MIKFSWLGNCSLHAENLFRRLESFFKSSLAFTHSNGMRYVNLAFILTFISCTRDVLPLTDVCMSTMPTYNTNVKDIIDRTCAYTGCHAGRGIAPGLYTNYNGLIVHIRTGSFEDRVVNQKDHPSLGMPPDNSVYPESKQDDLTDVQLDILRCWIESGFPR